MKRVIGALIFGVIFLCGGYIMLNNTLYNSTFDLKNQYKVDYNKLSIENLTLSTNEEINVVFSKKDDGIVFLYFHGNVGRIPYIINFFRKRHSFVSPAYPGYNGSSGKPSVANVYEVADKMKDFVRKHFPNRKIYVIGHSLGSQPAIYYGTIENKVHTLGIVAGFDSIYGMCGDRLGKLKFVCLIAKKSFNAGELVKYKKFKFKFFIFHNPNDKIIPLKRDIRLFEKVKTKEKHFIELADGTHGKFNINFVTNEMLGID